MRKIDVLSGRALDMLSLTATNDVAELAGILSGVSDYAREQKWTTQLTGRVSLIVEELFVNFATHAHIPKGAAPRFELSIASHGDGVECIIVDNSAPYDPRQASAAIDATIDDRPVGGLGLTILMQMVTGIDYDTVDGRNVTRIRLQDGAI